MKKLLCVLMLFYIGYSQCPTANNFTNVLDIVALANCVLSNTIQCCDSSQTCNLDCNLDGEYNVLDIVLLANCILAENCGE